MNGQRRRILILLGATTVDACTSLPAERGPAPLTDVIARSASAVVAIGAAKGITGSGFRIAGTRLIATAAHVAETPLQQTDPHAVWHGQNYPIQLKSASRSRDVALLELVGEAPMPGLTLAPQDAPITLGEWVVIIGCPFGQQPTATVGIVSAVPGTITEPVRLKELMQLNAAVNPGNSGGPVVNLRGQVIGIANATIPGGFGLGFATPVAALAPLLAG
jgi:serine protease Do